MIKAVASSESQYIRKRGREKDPEDALAGVVIEAENAGGSESGS
jgi:hypothetical protein